MVTNKYAVTSCTQVYKAVQDLTMAIEVWGYGDSPLWLMVNFYHQFG